MASTWDRIPQTHRAILFEEFTHPADTSATNLADLLRLYSAPDAIDEDLYLDIKDKLEVRSFDDFLKKFQPKVFQYTTGTASGVPMFQYTTNPLEAQKIDGAKVIKITDHTYYEMLVNMYSQKGDSGLANIEFNDAKLREILTPKREIEALYDTRQQIPLLMEKYDKTIKRNENAAPIAKRLKKIRREALDQIKNPTALMAIGLDDINRKIATADEKLLQLNAASSMGGNVPKLLSGRGGFDNNGRWVLIPAKASMPDLAEDTDSPSDAVEKFAKMLKDDLDKNAPDETEFTKALIVSAYTGTELANPTDNMDSTALAEYREGLVSRKKTIEKCFRQAKEAFIQVLSENVQKLLCVKIFFDHATVKGGNEGTLPKVGLIVANCPPAKLIDDKIKGKFEATMRRLGLDVSDENKLWFAILPHVLDEDYSDGGDGNISLDDDMFDMPDEDDVKAPAKGTDFSAAKSILKLMDECKIMTVFNFAPDKRTTFSALTAATVNELQDKLEPLNMEHAVYALPNFTIMCESTVPLSDDDDATKIDVPATYIDAAYVAAGLLIAAQQPEYWTSRGFKEEQFLPDNPCVRIDFEWDRITPVMLTKFNRERSVAWSSDVVQALTKNHFGFAFDGDCRYDDKTNSFIDKIYILNARTLKHTDGSYQPIFRTLMKDFIRAYLKTYTSAGLQLKVSQLKNFDRVVRDWEKQIQGGKQDPINLLFRDGEKILLDENNNIKVELSGGEDLVEVEIVEFGL
ncbi:MAG: hypothetical protein SR1Q5_08090 [Quinella sp. 1Q5]|nr:hypothetical protein [Quinella sp. 1Q5]